MSLNQQESQPLPFAPDRSCCCPAAVAAVTTTSDAGAAPPAGRRPRFDHRQG